MDEGRGVAKSLSLRIETCEAKWYVDKVAKQTEVLMVNVKPRQ